MDIPVLPQDSSQLDQRTVADQQRATTDKELLLHFSTALEVSADSIVIGDLEGKILYVNEAAWRGHDGIDQGFTAFLSQVSLKEGAATSPRYQQHRSSGADVRRRASPHLFLPV